jgi:flavin-dependent dehydrogenase
MSAPQRHAIIIATALAGSVMACYLAKARQRVAVYERHPDPCPGRIQRRFTPRIP